MLFEDHSVPKRLWRAMYHVRRTFYQKSLRLRPGIDNGKIVIVQGLAF